MSGFDGPDSILAALAEEPALKPHILELTALAEKAAKALAEYLEAVRLQGSAQATSDRDPSNVGLKAEADAAKETERELGERYKAVQDELNKSSVRASEATALDVRTVIAAVSVTHRRADTQRVLQQLINAQAVDIVFVFDATGSMHSQWNMLKENIKELLTEIKRFNPDLSFRLGVAAYRDPEDGPTKHLQTIPLTEDSKLETFLEEVRVIRCGGGGDACEDVIIGLDAASKFDWKYENRLLFLCGDAPCHGAEYNSGYSDNHPRGLGISIKPALEQLISNNVQMHFWRINKSTDKMISLFNEDARMIAAALDCPLPGDVPSGEYFTTSELNGTDADMQASMRGIVSKSVSSSLSSSKAKVKSLGAGHVLGVALRTVAEDEDDDEDDEDPTSAAVCAELAKISLDD